MNYIKMWNELKATIIRAKKTQIELYSKSDKNEKWYRYYLLTKIKELEFVEFCMNELESELREGGVND